MTLSFVRLREHDGLVSDLALDIRDKKTRKDIGWYYFDEGSAPKVSLISTTDPTLPGWTHDPDGSVRPHGSATFLGLDPDGSLLQSAPSSRTVATRYVIIPELGAVLKGERWGVADKDAIGAERNSGFVLSGCAG